MVSRPVDESGYWAMRSRLAAQPSAEKHYMRRRSIFFAHCFGAASAMLITYSIPSQAWSYDSRQSSAAFSHIH